MSSATTLISVEEYLQTSYKPNCEYIDGVLRQKPMATSVHGIIQMNLGYLLRARGWQAGAEVTLRMSPTKFLVPDVAADVRLERPYPTKPVRLCVEILSPDNRLGAMLTKCEEYHDWGVPYCWVIDPLKVAGWEYHANSDLIKVEASGNMRAGEISVPLAEILAA